MWSFYHRKIQTKYIIYNKIVVQNGNDTNVLVGQGIKKNFLSLPPLENISQYQVRDTFSYSYERPFI